MRKNIAAGNWKMNLSLEEALALTSEIAKAEINRDVSVIIGVPAVYLGAALESSKDAAQVHISAQNCHPEPKGAFTGEISTSMLDSIGIKHVIIGHSERRQHFNESDAFLKAKVDTLIANDFTPIFCCGEPLEVREASNQDDYVLNQLKNSIFHLDGSDFQKLIIAYEPIWAIGTGKTASPEQAQEMHGFIRAKIAEKYSDTVADSVSILYGGSVKPANAKELFANPDVDGGLVGGASLKAESFIDIINSFK